MTDVCPMHLYCIKGVLITDICSLYNYFSSNAIQCECSLKQGEATYRKVKCNTEYTHFKTDWIYLSLQDQIPSTEDLILS